MDKTTGVLIVTGAIVLQQGLAALLESLPGISTVKAVGDLSRAHAWIEAHHPAMVLLDVALPGRDVHTVLETFRAISPAMRRVLLVDQVADVRWVPQFAEAIVIKGESPSAVAAIVTYLLSSKGEKDGHYDSDK